MSSWLIWLEEMEKHLEGDMARRRTSVCNKSQISAWVHAWLHVNTRKCAGGNPAWPAQLCGTSKSHCHHFPWVPYMLGIPIPYIPGNVNSSSMIEVVAFIQILTSLFWAQKNLRGWTHHTIFYKLLLLKKKKYLIFYKPWHSTSQLDSFRQL